MTVGAPAWFLLFAVTLIAALLVALWALWRIDASRRFGARTPTAFRTLAAMVVLLLAAVAAAFAAGRPQFGEKTTAVERRGIDLVVVLDVSQSMLATDVEPSRLARSQQEIASLLDRLQGDRAGLVIFAGAPFTRSPLTGDLAALRELVLGVDRERGLVPPGSDLGAALRRAHELLQSGTAETRAVLIVSDGEDHGGAVDEAIATLASSGVRVYTAGAGTPEGAPVLDADAAGTLRPRVGPAGAPVISRLDADALEAMADIGDGRYIDLSSGGSLATLAAELDALQNTTFEREESAEPIERFQIFAGIALALVLLASFLGSPLHRLTRRVRRLAPLAAAGLMIAAICGTDAAEWNRRGNTQYAAGEYSAALESYRRAQELSPQEQALYYNRANAFAALGEYVSAIDEAQRALPAGDPAFEALVEYALGNHYANAGRLRDALEAYRRSLYAVPTDEDAKANYEIVEHLLTPTNPSPTPTPPAEVPETPRPGDEGGDQPASPEPGEGTPNAGSTPQPGGTPISDIPPEELQRLLEEALAGIDEEFTLEEALTILELIEEQNRGQIQDQPPGGGPLDY